MWNYCHASILLNILAGRFGRHDMREYRNSKFLVISWDAVCLMCLSCWTISLVYSVCVLLVSETVMSAFGWIDNSLPQFILHLISCAVALFWTVGSSCVYSMHFILTQRPFVRCPVSECSSQSATNHYDYHCAFTRICVCTIYFYEKISHFERKCKPCRIRAEK